jgi:hypothetical protein
MTPTFSEAEKDLLGLVGPALGRQIPEGVQTATPMATPTETPGPPSWFEEGLTPALLNMAANPILASSYFTGSPSFINFASNVNRLAGPVSPFADVSAFPKEILDERSFAAVRTGAFRDFLQGEIMQRLEQQRRAQPDPALWALAMEARLRQAGSLTDPMAQLYMWGAPQGAPQYHPEALDLLPGVR